MAAAEKKVDPHALPPKKNLMVIGIVLLVGGFAWFTYDAFLRPETEQEKKERIEKEKEAAEKAKRPGGH
jgi:hypothetical protein